MKKYTFNQKIIIHIEDFIDDVILSKKTLLEIFKETKKYKKGTYYTYYPDLLPKNKFYAFEHSWEQYYSISDIDELKEHAMHFIIQHLKSDPNAICIAHAGFWKLTDPWLKGYNFDFKIISYNNEMYWILTNKQQSPTKVRGFMERSIDFSPPQMILFSKNKKLNNAKDQINPVNISQIKQIIQDTNKMLVNTNDLRGYIFWENENDK